jgi:hypothetical protein
VSELDDRMAEDRKRLSLIRALTDGERLDLLAYLSHHAATLVDMYFWDREADSTGTRYDMWGRALIILPAVAFAVIVLLITWNVAGSLW